MGQSQIKMLEQYSKDFEAHPDVRSELQQHLLETKQQIEDIEECLSGLGAKASAAKDALGTISGLAQGVGTNAFKDKLVKDLLALYASEQFAYACYSALAEGARHHMADEVADICERIAEEEMAMAEWVEEQLPAVVTATLTAREEV
jgi:ferritin-like metal-binding protein YciE